MSELSESQEAAVRRIAAHIRRWPGADPLALAHEIVLGEIDKGTWFAEDPDRVAARYADLSTREAEILNLITSGRQDKEIARILDISIGTVKAHAKSAFHKLRVKNRTQAAITMVAAGLRPLEEPDR